MKKILFLLIGLILVVLLYMLLRPTATKENKTTTENSKSSSEVTSAALDPKICAQLSNQSDVPAKINFIDVKSNLAFCENDIGVMPVLTAKNFTQVKKAFHALDFAEFKEELVDRGYITWQADSIPKEKFSMISGFATDKVKTIIINSEDNIQPNRFFIRKNLWFWYYTFHKAKVNMPIKVTVFDEKGQIISGDDE